MEEDDSEDSQATLHTMQQVLVSQLFLVTLYTQVYTVYRVALQLSFQQFYQLKKDKEYAAYL